MSVEPFTARRDNTPDPFGNDAARIPQKLAGSDQFERMKLWLELFMGTAEVAKVLARTNFVPADMRGQPEDIAAAMMKGLELGIDPLDALANLYVVKGRVGFSAEFMRRRVLEAGHDIVFDEQTDERCKVRGRRAGSQDWTTVVFTKAQAQQAGVQNLAKYPTDMLVARASSRLCRRVFPDVLAGATIIEDIIDGDIGEDAPAPGRALQRKRQPRTKPPAEAPAAPSEAAASGPACDLDEFPTAEAVEQTTIGPAADDDPDTTDAPAGPASAAQNRKMHALFRDVGLTDRQDRLIITGEILGYTMETSAKLTSAEANTLIDTLERWIADTDIDLEARITDLLQAWSARQTSDEPGQG